MKIIIETIAHEKQRYPTVGDWYYDADGTLQIKVSELGDDKMNACVGLHELAEALMCKSNGVSQEEVDEFDKDFEAKRQEGNVDEPGDSPLAPYALEHGVASGIERIFGAELGVDWNDYANRVEAMP